MQRHVHKKLGVLGGRNLLGLDVDLGIHCALYNTLVEIMRLVWKKITNIRFAFKIITG